MFNAFLLFSLFAKSVLTDPEPQKEYYKDPCYHEDTGKAVDAQTAPGLLQRNMGTISKLFEHGVGPSWGSKCDLFKEFCAPMVAHAIVITPTPHRDSAYHMAFHILGEDCFDLCQDDKWIVCGTNIVGTYMPQFWGAGIQALVEPFMGPSFPAQTVRNKVLKVVSVGMHASYLVELRYMWMNHSPLEFEFDEHNLDVGRCAAAKCAVPVTQHPVFRRVSELYKWTVNSLSPLNCLHGIPELADKLELEADVLVCTHPPYICRMFLEFARRGVPVLGWFGGSILHSVTEQDQPQWYDEFYEMAGLPNVQFTTVATYLSAMIWYQTGAVLPAIRSFGVANNLRYEPVNREVLIWKYSSQCCNNVNIFDIALNELLKDDPEKEYIPFVHLSTLRAQNRSDYATLSGFRAVVMYAYDVTVFSFFEWYHAGTPIFMPSPLLAVRHAFRGSVNSVRGKTIRTGWSANWTDLVGEEFAPPENIESPYEVWSSIPARLFWLQFVEWFRYPEVQLFDSMTQLISLLRGDLGGISERMLVADAEMLSEVSSFWTGAVANITRT